MDNVIFPGYRTDIQFFGFITQHNFENVYAKWAS